MPSNIEIKARLHDPEKTEAIVRQIADGEAEVIEQDDVFYSTPRGRLKLRTLAPDQGELIHYDRPDEVGPSSCEYTIANTSDPTALDTILCMTLGARGRIRKTRKLYMAGRTRIHLDDVEHLGHFLELEVVLNDNESPEAAQSEASALIKKLDIRDEDLVEYAYIDLVETEIPEG